MKKILMVLLYSAMTDLLVASMKLFGGIISGCGALIADAFYTFSNFITDVMALIGSKISKKRPNKFHPFGFGKVEYVASIFMGIVIFMIGTFMLVLTFKEKTLHPSNITIIIVLLSILLKVISSLLLFHTSKTQKNEMLIINAKISITDIYSTSIVLLIILLSFVLKNELLFSIIDMLASLIISIHILKMSFTILKENTIAIIGEIDDNEELMREIEKEVETIKNVDLVNIKLIKYGTYYKAELTIRINPNMRVKEFINIENKINKKVKKSKFKIKYTTIKIDHLKQK